VFGKQVVLGVLEVLLAEAVCGFYRRLHMMLYEET